MPILQRAIELWYHDPACTTPVLKLMAELVHNRYERPVSKSLVGVRVCLLLQLGAGGCWFPAVFSLPRSVCALKAAKGTGGTGTVSAGKKIEWFSSELRHDSVRPGDAINKH